MAAALIVLQMINFSNWIQIVKLRLRPRRKFASARMCPLLRTQVGDGAVDGCVHDGYVDWHISMYYVDLLPSDLLLLSRRFCRTSNLVSSLGIGVHTISCCHNVQTGWSISRGNRLHSFCAETNSRCFALSAS